MQQGDAALVGLGLRELQQRVNLETHSIPSVAPLESTPMIHLQDLAKDLLKVKSECDSYVVEEIPDVQNQPAETGQVGAISES